MNQNMDFVSSKLNQVLQIFDGIGTGRPSITGDYTEVATGGGGRGSGGGSNKVTTGTGGSGGSGGSGGGKLTRSGTPSPRSGGIDFSRNMLFGSALLAAPTVLQAGSDVLQGRTLDAAGTLAGGAGTLAVTEGIGRTLQAAPSPYVKGAGTLIRGAGAVFAPLVGNIVGNTLEKQRAERTGVAPANASPVEQRVATRARIKQDAEDQLTINQNILNAQLAGMTDVYKNISDQEYVNLQRNIPLINQLNDAQLVRQQALMNTQANNYAMLGTLATAGKLATGAQAESGATLRTALANSPYAGAVMQSPNISF